MPNALPIVSPFQGFVPTGLGTQGGASLALGWYVSAPSGRCHSKQTPAARARRGQSLVEFALVAIVIYLILAAILTFGHLLFAAQTLQQAADVAARELAHTALPATAGQSGSNLFMDALYSSDPSYAAVRQSLFDPSKLQFDMSTLSAGQSVLDVVKTWPIVNQMLYPAMIVQTTDAGGQFLWYPGAVPCTDSTSTSRTVWCVAEVTSRASGGAETIQWRPVIEEIQTGAFDVASSQHGLVALRVNYGYQSATMSAYPPQTTWPPQPNGLVGTPGQAYAANDSGVTVTSGNYTPSGSFPQSSTGIYGGPYGLGSQQAWGMAVRPFRRLLSLQAAYRREVFQ
jgi:Flp pilus assembly protein TadG